MESIRVGDIIKKKECFYVILKKEGATWTVGKIGFNTNFDGLWIGSQQFASVITDRYINNTEFFFRDASVAYSKETIESIGECGIYYHLKYYHEKKKANERLDFSIQSIGKTNQKKLNVKKQEYKYHFDKDLPLDAWNKLESKMKENNNNNNKNGNDIKMVKRGRYHTAILNGMQFDQFIQKGCGSKQTEKKITFPLSVKLHYNDKTNHLKVNAKAKTFEKKK